VSVLVSPSLSLGGCAPLCASLSDGASYLATNAAAAGVIVLPSGLQYTIERSSGSSLHPTRADTVRVHYAGTTIEGKEFDCQSTEEGQQHAHSREDEQHISARIEEEAMVCCHATRSLPSSGDMSSRLPVCAPACPSLSPSPSASYSRGSPATFGVTQVIAGWTEILQVMAVGDIYRVTIPSGLAYGSRGAGGLIGPNAVLNFKIELIGIEGKDL
jgi:FKBP-type peptidyl-prolyl cis-trans isomerase